ncbi:hypothetical protein JW868_00795 [Candidatus Woesearchaeota archaeon]|nr:hypothetical protein [Candidatus Woesearchaeota archaeon]
MADPEIIEKTPITITELKAELKSIKKRDEELSFRGNRTEEYVNMFASLSQKDVKELKKKIQELDIPRLKDEHIAKLIDVIPASVPELKIVLQGYTLTVSNENLDKIFKVMQGFLKK